MPRQIQMAACSPAVMLLPITVARYSRIGATRKAVTRGAAR